MIPPGIEQRLQANGEDPSREAREAFLVDQYRREKITHGQLAVALDAYETDGVLKMHGVTLDITDEEPRGEVLSLRDAKPE